MDNAERVFKSMCLLSTQYGAGVFNSYELAEASGLSRYSVFRAVHLLAERGLVERKSVGVPTTVDPWTGGWLSDAAPPINGWAITEAGRQTDVWKETMARAMNAGLSAHRTI